MEDPKPKNHGEEVAIFRHGLIGELAIRADSLDHGERSEEAAIRHDVTRSRRSSVGCTPSKRAASKRWRPAAAAIAVAAASSIRRCASCSATSGASIRA